MRTMNLENNIQHINLLSHPGIVAISTCRGVVIENDNYSGFNACHYTGDTLSHVEDCRKRLCQLLSIPLDHLIIPRQTHSLNVAVIESLPISSSVLENVDALVTTLPDVAIAVNTADCVPIILYDPVAHVKAVVHSGWKGTVGRIASNTINTMKQCGATPSHIIAAMGPCICGKCFEVGSEVVDLFIENGFDSPKVILRHLGQRDHIDLSQACLQTLTECGIPRDNISLSHHCSRCNPTIFFSARRLGINSGRTLTLIK